MYAEENFRTKKDLKVAVAGAVAAGVGGVECYQPGPFGPSVPDGSHCCEGPHFPEAHKWYASVEVKGGKIVKVKG